MDAALPDIPYVNVNFTMPCELWPILRQNRRLWHDLPAVAAAAVQHWVNAKYGARVLLLVVQQTFGGLLTFHPHLHILVSAGGLQESGRRWIARLRFDKRELMHCWRYALTTYLARAGEAHLIRSNMSSDEIKALLEGQYKRSWNVFVGHITSKTRFLRYAGRYMRRPPIAEYRLERVTAQIVEYLGKDTRAKQPLKLRFSNEGFVDALKDHVLDRFRHAMRYFGLLSPRSKHLTSSGLFALLEQTRRPRPRRLSWADSFHKHFRTDPLIDSLGQRMYWTGRISPTTP